VVRAESLDTIRVKFYQKLFGQQADVIQSNENENILNINKARHSAGQKISGLNMAAVRLTTDQVTKLLPLQRNLRKIRHDLQ
jgi:hypothetical protein